MKFINLSRFAAVAVFAGVSAVGFSASLFSGPAFYSIAPYTQMGTVQNLLAINNPTFGITVAGAFNITVPAGMVSGTLLRYQVKRPLNLTFGSQLLQMVTQLVGFSAPPWGGTFVNTFGYCKSYLEISGMPANANLTLVNGVANWNANYFGQTFNYTSGVDAFLVQDFELDGFKTAGPSGVWVVDLPVDSLMQPVPEPASMFALGLGVLGFLRKAKK